MRVEADILMSHGMCMQSLPQGKYALSVCIHQDWKSPLFCSKQGSWLLWQLSRTAQRLLRVLHSRKPIL
jgi:hypothetical protein